MARLFLAAWPSPPAVARLRTLDRPDQRGVRWVPADNWHITLRFLGEAEPADVEAALAPTVLPAATAELGPVVRRLGRSLLVVPVAGLEQLAAAVRAATAGAGEPPGRPFNGHLTLARLRPGAPCDLVGTPIAARFRVRDVLLVRSALGRGGATYHVVRRWATAR